MSFNQLELIEPLLKAVSEEGYTMPTPIQQQSIPVVLQKRDLLACAQTGTGKTAAFSIPLLQLMHQQTETHPQKSKNIRALILTPTRELAIQIGENISAYGKFLHLRHTVIFGGVNQFHQVTAIRRGVDILVATPGRLLDLIQQRIITLQNIEWLVLDEADRMLDMGFVKDVKRIIAMIPTQRQTLFFSATMPEEIQDLSDSLLKNPVRVEVTPPATTVELIQQSVYHVEKANKQDLVFDLMKDKNIRSALIFTRTKHGADRLAKWLTKNGIRTEAIHGNKSQNFRQSALANFKSGKTRVLVATDLAARGIDIDELTHVINFELPNVPETYVHRIGRTGRAGASGIAISLCASDEKVFLRDIQRLIKKTIPAVTNHQFNTMSSIVAEPKMPITSYGHNSSRHITRHHRQPNRSGGMVIVKK